ncbi:MAG: prepilin-type N-terminal cleavage/methylation domain-containing protein [bacterium]
MSIIKKGFTLIELLVVISIISILIALGSTSYQRAVRLSRDSKRKTDLEQLRQALEIYRSENGVYPLGINANASVNNNPFTTALVGGGFISSIPEDPKYNSYYYRYRKTGSHTTYSLCATLEIDPEQTLVNCSGQSCGTGSLACNYEVTNP